MKSSHNLTHDRLQQECFMYLFNAYPESRKCCFHPANEIKMLSFDALKDILLKGLEILGVYTPKNEIIEAAGKINVHELRMRAVSLNKNIGVVPGVTDLIFYWKGVLYAFDIKIDNDYIKPEQKLFFEAIERQGGKGFEIRDFATFKKIIDGIMKKVLQ